jgi:HAMP domain-containing protein
MLRAGVQPTTVNPVHPSSPALVWLRNAAVLAVLAAGTGLVAWKWLERPVGKTIPSASSEAQKAAAKVDAASEAEWATKKIPPAPRADDLTIIRRLSLALTGSIPSLEEIRDVQTLKGENVPQQWLVYVGTENGPFLIYRRRRLVEWLSEALLQNRPYDRIVRDLIGSKGVWTTSPAVNFITVTNEPGKGPDEKKLAAKISRAFLGVRIDCVECHDGKLGSPWKQSDFHQLAAYFGQTKFDLTGLRDDPKQQYKTRYLGETEPAVISTQVPWKPELMPEKGTPRSRLADWITAKENKAFARAVVNRFWALLFNKPLVTPVDDIPLEGPFPPGMELIAEDFIAHDYDLHRLIRVITSTRLFAASSLSDHPEAERHWAAFPVTRLRPEQMAGSVIQAASLGTLDAEAHVLFRIKRDIDVGNFVKRYGDRGEDDFDDGGGTIPQRLLLMNGNMVTDNVKNNPLTAASTRIGLLSPDDRTAVESAYLAIFTRKPTPAEATHFEALLASAKSNGMRSNTLSDLYWTLMNATEFSWNH